MKTETSRGLIVMAILALLCYFGCRSCNKAVNAHTAELERLKTENPAEYRRLKINALVDPDGSIDEVEHAAAQLLKDPSSFQHISTEHNDNGSVINVYMRFRGKNSFGAVVPHYVNATMDIEGNVTSIKALE
jgi:hypothetical protein